MLDMKKALTKLMKAPIVVEQGTSGIWTYRKWSDGTAECWGRIVKTNFDITRQWGSWYISPSGTENEFVADYPANLFIAAPVENATLVSGVSMTQFMSGANSSSTKDHTARYLAARGTSTTGAAATLFIHAIGKWK